MNEISGTLNGRGRRFVIVLSRFNSLITEQLLQGAVDCLLRHGAEEADITVVRVPGAWELPQVVAKVASRDGLDGVIALGCVIRGETPHFEYVAGECAKGLSSVSQEHGIPIGFGVLTVDTIEQAVERAGTKAGNKGAEAAITMLEMVNLLSTLD